MGHKGGWWKNFFVIRPVRGQDYVKGVVRNGLDSRTDLKGNTMVNTRNYERLTTIAKEY